MAKTKEEAKERPMRGDKLRALWKSKDYEGLHHGLASEMGPKVQDRITTGSVLFDQVLGGGFRSGGWARFYGDAECGKTSQGLRWARNWQEFYPNDGFVIIFNAEGRITEDLLARSGIHRERDRFEMIYTNSYEGIMSSMQTMILEDDDSRFFFMIDSSDACERDKDKEKELGEAEKIGGGASILSAAGKRLSLLFAARQHFLYVSSQLRDKMTMGGYGGPSKGASGGNAIRFYSSLTGQIKKPWSDTFIFDDLDKDNKERKRIGTMVEILLEKTPNEKTGQTVRFPVKHGHVGGIWEAYEAYDICEKFGYWSRPGKTGNFVVDPHYAEDLKTAGIEFEETFRSTQLFRDYFDTNPKLVEYVRDRFRRNYINEV